MYLFSFRLLYTTNNKEDSAMENIYYMDFNVTGSERKRLVNAIRAFTGDDAKYCGAPSFAYEVGAFYCRRSPLSAAQRSYT